MDDTKITHAFIGVGILIFGIIQIHDKENKNNRKDKRGDGCFPSRPMICTSLII